MSKKQMPASPHIRTLVSQLKSQLEALSMQTEALPKPEATEGSKNRKKLLERLKKQIAELS